MGFFFGKVVNSVLDLVSLRCQCNVDVMALPFLPSFIHYGACTACQAQLDAVFLERQPRRAFRRFFLMLNLELLPSYPPGPLLPSRTSQASTCLWRSEVSGRGSLRRLLLREHGAVKRTCP